MMDAGTHFVEVVPEDMQTLGTEEETSPSVSMSMVSSSSMINMNNFIYSQVPDEIIMEGDEMGPDILGEIVTDDSPDMKVLPINQVIHMDLAREMHQETTLGGLEGQGTTYSYMLFSPSSQMHLQEGEANEEIILGTNSLIEQEDIIEGGRGGGGEVEVGPNMAVEEALSEPTLKKKSRALASIEDIGYECPDCGKSLKSRSNLKKHISKHHSVSRKVARSADYSSSEESSLYPLYSCPSCSYVSVRRDRLDKHIKKHVLQEGVHPCGKKRTKPDAPLQRQRHNAEEYRCSLCPYTCTVYEAYRKHQKKAHMPGAAKLVPVKVSCKICGKDRSTEEAMENHMKKHRSGNNFLCDVCGFESIQLKKIIQHRRMHTGEKPHLCPHCSYRSARRDNLRSHVRRMHKKKNMYIDTFNPNE
ncbi:hypothetical protein MRX96_057141 [Rhipicephalus microplus]